MGTSIAEVRAERVGGGNGRVYKIDFTANDQSGAVCTGYVVIDVPNNEGETGGPIDDGPFYDSTTE